jgi:hypothetical protein
MGLGICLDERYKPVARVMHYPTDTDFASCIAMFVIVLEDNNRLRPTRASVINIPSVKVTVVAIVPANRADALLLLQQLDPVAFPLGGGHSNLFLSSPRSQLTSTLKAWARALSS